MKNILVATDFSASARNAAVYAAALARFAGSRIILLHVYSLRMLLEEQEEPVRKRPPEAGLQKKMDLLAQELHSTYGVSVTRLLKPGFAADEIPALAKRVKAEIVVLGTRCSQETTIGETMAAMLGSGDVGVMCVPPGATFRPEAGIAYRRQDTAFAAQLAANLFTEIQQVYGTATGIPSPQEALATEDVLAADGAETSIAGAGIKVPATLTPDQLPDQLLVLFAGDASALEAELRYHPILACSQTTPLLVLPRIVY